MKSIAIILTIIGWVLVACGAFVFAASPWISAATLEPFKNAVLVGILFALSGHLFTQARAAKESAENRSLFYLESCVLAFDEARALLKDGNNDRITWIAGGRALTHAHELAADVTVGAHRRVLELHKLKYRGFFHEALADKPASFFYGASDIAVPLDEVAAASTARGERGGRVVTSTVRELSENSIHAVWEAAQWPVDCKDPLDKKFSPQERDKLLVLFPGLHEFLEHKDQWQSASGRLFPRNIEETR